MNFICYCFLLGLFLNLGATLQGGVNYWANALIIVPFFIAASTACFKCLSWISDNWDKSYQQIKTESAFRRQK